MKCIAQDPSFQSMPRREVVRPASPGVYRDIRNFMETKAMTNTAEVPAKDLLVDAKKVDGLITEKEAEVMEV